MKIKHLYLCLFVSLIILSCGSKESDIIFHNSHEPKRQNTPFSDAVETDDFLFLSGQIGRDHEKGLLVQGGIQEQTRQVIQNIKDVLAHHNMDIDRVVKCTVILKNIEDFAAFNEVYTQYFTNKPARTTFGADLAANALIEIEVIAAK